MINCYWVVGIVFHKTMLLILFHFYTWTQPLNHIYLLRLFCYPFVVECRIILSSLSPSQLTTACNLSWSLWEITLACTNWMIVISISTPSAFTLMAAESASTPNILIVHFGLFSFGKTFDSKFVWMENSIELKCVTFVASLRRIDRSLVRRCVYRRVNWSSIRGKHPKQQQQQHNAAEEEEKEEHKNSTKSEWKKCLTYNFVIGMEGKKMQSFFVTFNFPQFHSFPFLSLKAFDNPKQNRTELSLELIILY